MWSGPQLICSSKLWPLGSFTLAISARPLPLHEWLCSLCSEMRMKCISCAFVGNIRNCKVILKEKFCPLSSPYHQTLERKFVHLMESSDPQIPVATAQFIYIQLCTVIELTDVFLTSVTKNVIIIIIIKLKKLL